MGVVPWDLRWGPLAAQFQPVGCGCTGGQEASLLQQRGLD